MEGGKPETTLLSKKSRNPPFQFDWELLHLKKDVLWFDVQVDNRVQTLGFVVQVRQRFGDLSQDVSILVPVEDRHLVQDVQHITMILLGEDAHCRKVSLLIRYSNHIVIPNNVGMTHPGQGTEVIHDQTCPRGGIARIPP